MKKVYEAIGKEKEEFIDYYNEIKAFEEGRVDEINANKLLMITRLSAIPQNRMIDGTWSINGIEQRKSAEDDILIFDPLEQHLTDKILKLEIVGTKFDGSVKLSDNAFILMPQDKYIKLASHWKLEEVSKKCQ